MENKKLEGKEMPEKIPYMTGEYSSIGGYIEKIIMIDKSHPEWEEALEHYLLIEGK